MHMCGLDSERALLATGKFRIAIGRTHRAAEGTRNFGGGVFSPEG
jgi:hypothetical protein